MGFPFLIVIYLAYDGYDMMKGVKERGKGEMVALWILELGHQREENGIQVLVQTPHSYHPSFPLQL